MFKSHSIPLKTTEDDNPFLLSFSDLMAGLLAIFILVLVLTLVELEKRREDLRMSRQELVTGLEDIQRLQERIIGAMEHVSRREGALASMLAQIQKDLRTHGIEVVIAENDSVLRIPEKQLQFALGKYDISSACSGPANEIGTAILTALRRPENRALLDTVFIEGHTDSVSNYREMGNWGLSTYRAISLWKYWTESPGKFTELKDLRTLPLDSSQTRKPLISVSGYADTRSTHGLLDGKTMKEDRPEDRRIDIRFTLASSEKKGLEALGKELTKLRERTNSLIYKLKDFSRAP